MTQRTAASVTTYNNYKMKFNARKAIVIIARVERRNTWLSNVILHLHLHLYLGLLAHAFVQSDSQ